MSGANIITRWSALTNVADGRRSAMPWTLFVDELRSRGQQAFAGDHHHAGWSPATFKNGKRELAGVVHVHAMVLDYDHGTLIEAVATTWADCVGVIHTTRRHTSASPRCRVILPLARPVTVEEYARLWGWANARATALGQEIDEAPKDASRFWFLPGSLSGEFELHELDGDLIDPDAVLRQLDEDAADAPARVPLQHNLMAPSEHDRVVERARRYVARMPAAISGQRGHDATFDVALVLVQGFALPQMVSLDLLREYSARCEPPWSEKELDHKIDAAAKAKHVTNGWLFDDDRRDWRTYAATARGDHAPQSGAPVDDWPEPQPLAETLLPVARLAIDMIPDPFRPWVADVARRLQAPLEFIAVGVVVAVASVIGRAIGIRPKLRDDWTVVPNLWGGVIAEPGMFKSPSLKAALKPLALLVDAAIEEHQRAVDEAETQAPVSEAKIKTFKKRIQNAVESRSGRGKGRLHVVRDDDEAETPDVAAEDPALLAVELAALQKSGAPPVLRRYIVNDSSVEKLGELLNQNERGLLLFRDELTGFLYKLDSDGHESDRAFYLEAWDGNGQSFTYDRIQRGTIRIEAPCVSLLGGIQPGPLTAYVRSTWKSGAGDDGLVQRLQLVVWPDVIKECHYVDEWPDSDAWQLAHDIFRRVAAAGAAVAVGAYPDPDESERIPYLRFAPDAQPLFDAWYQALMVKVRAGDDHPAIRSHLSKYASLMPSLALTFHVVDVLGGAAASGPVTARSAALAIRWTGFLETHARRMYAAITRRREIAGALLGAKIKNGKLKDGFTLRDVYVKGWAGLIDPEDVKLAVEELVESGWLRAFQAEPDPRGGRPTVRYSINPQVRHA